MATSWYVPDKGTSATSHVAVPPSCTRNSALFWLNQRVAKMNSDRCPCLTVGDRANYNSLYIQLDQWRIDTCSACYVLGFRALG